MSSFMKDISFYVIQYEEANHYENNINQFEELFRTFEEAKKHTDAPTIIEFMISTDELVLPMVKGGNPMSEMILK